MEKGYNVADEVLNETDDLVKKAKTLYKKGINEGRVYYAPKTNQYYVLEKGEGRGTFVPFNLTKDKNSDTSELSAAEKSLVGEVDGITNYEYGTGDTKTKSFGKKEYEESIQEGTDYITQNVDMQNIDTTNIRPTNLSPNKSAYENYLSDYRNR